MPDFTPRIHILAVRSAAFAVLIPVLVCGLVAWSGIRLVRVTRAASLLAANDDPDSLQRALRLDSHQPAAHSRLAFQFLYDPVQFDPARALSHLEAAARLAPHRYDLWLDAGRAYEQNGDFARAADSFVLATVLAPNYFQTHWRYANFLLRSGQPAMAVEEFCRAARINPDLLESTCEILWQASGGQFAAVRDFGLALQDSKSRLAVVRYLMANRQSPEEAWELWRSVPLDQVATLEGSEQFSGELVRSGRSDLAYQVALRIKEAQLGFALPTEERAFYNGDFEHPTGRSAVDWEWSAHPGVLVSVDAEQAHTGSRSLRLEFIQHDRVNFTPGIRHTVWVEPSSEYVLQFYYRTAEMLRRTGLSVSVWEVAGPNNRLLGQSELGSVSDWTAAECRFQTSPEARTIRVSITRRPTESLYDYVSGKAWFDSFTLTREASTGG